jgi:cytochrome bd ubiquinol oxidase subunit I
LTLAGYLVLYAGLLSAYVSVVFYLARKAGPGEAPRRMAKPQAEGPPVMPYVAPKAGDVQENVHV